MSATYECPSCHRTLATPDDVAGKRVKCGSCGTVFTAAVVDVVPAESPFAITAQPPAKQVSLPPQAAPGEHFRDLIPRYDIPSWADRELPDSGVLPGRTRAAVAIVCLVVCALLTAVDMGASALHHQLLVRAENGEAVLEQEEQTIDIVEAAVGLATFAFALGTAVAFCAWFYRAYKNLAFLRASHLTVSPGWAVAYFFIPILNLYRPYQIAREIWQASDPRVPLAGTSSWQFAPNSWTIRLWWTFWLVGNVLGSIGTRLSLSATTAAQTQVALEVDMLSSVPHLFAAGFAIWMIIKIQQRQALKLQRLNEEPQPDEACEPY